MKAQPKKKVPTSPLQLLPEMFHPLIRQWFADAVGSPTDIQMQTWPRIAAGEHILATAPTGSGKTLTAFLWAIHQLVTGHWDTGRTRVLYISPLKALNNDIQRNLITPLSQLKQVFETAGHDFPDIRVAVRSGDTSQTERRRMLRHPSEIFITTPESLGLMLSSQNAQSMLMSVHTVILDEIHALLDSRRGTWLMSAIERLTLLSGEFQRIALSATVNPLDKVAEFVGGYTLHGSAQFPKYQQRQVKLIQSNDQKEYRMKIRYPEAAVQNDTRVEFWDTLAIELKQIIAQNQSTLIFTNSRKLCEKLTFKINSGEASPVAYAHHGSLSREIRFTVENKLKNGELKAIVATHSLELGIDIGALDEVILVQSPFSATSAIQRIGRAGHKVGEVSRARVFPTHAQDFVESAVLTQMVMSKDLEPQLPLTEPLDVLAQIVISMTCVDTWDVDKLYAHICTAYPYRHLSRRHFDLVLHMLAGRYGNTRIRELNARVSLDTIDNTVTARKGARLALVMSGGVIPDRGYYHLRHNDTGARIGELDEEFVWEAYVGKTFTLGSQKWKIERITHNDVFVRSGAKSGNDIPFWIAEEIGRTFYFSEKILTFLETLNHTSANDMVPMLMRDCFMDKISANQLRRHCARQKEVTHCDLPHRHHVVVEQISKGPGGTPGNQVVIHTFWGARINKPLALAMDAAWEERFGERIEIYGGNDCIALMLPHEVPAAELLSLVPASSVETLLRKRLEGSGFFGARFREAAGRALLVTRNKMNQRMPLWMTRQKTQKLFHQVLGFTDFPIMLEAWRTCLNDEFDMENLHRMLEELACGEIAWTESVTQTPSPMAMGVAWDQINRYMYMTDAQQTSVQSSLSNELIRDVALNARLRPSVTRETVALFTEKRHRTAIGYAPTDGVALLDWVKERLLLPADEWESLLNASVRDAQISTDVLLEKINAKLAMLTINGKDSGIVAMEMLPLVTTAFHPDDSITVTTLTGQNKPAPYTAPNDGMDNDDVALFSQWLSFYGPMSITRIIQKLGVSPAKVDQWLSELIEDDLVVSGQLQTDGSTSDVCDTQNFESLLRLSRSLSAPRLEPRDFNDLQLFLTIWQQVGQQQSGGGDVDGVDALFEHLDKLMGYAAPPHLWEAEFFPARLSGYDPAWLDAIMQEEAMLWVGVAQKQVAFAWTQALDLVDRTRRRNKDVSPLLPLFEQQGVRFDFSGLQQQTKLGSGQLTDALWQAVWHGDVANNSFESVRKGIGNRFESAQIAHTAKPSGVRRRGAAMSFSKWKSRVPFSGTWSKVPWPDDTDDLLVVEERNREKVRLLLDRYGVLFKELLKRESSGYTWAVLFRTLRLMELSGEVVSGYFFHGIMGPQFMSHHALRIFTGPLDNNRIYWLNATDPISLCGIGVDAARGVFPKRIESNHCVFHGTKLVLVSSKKGEKITINASPDSDHIPHYFAPLHHLLRRRFAPLNSITVKTINGEPSRNSPYLPALQLAFDVVTGYKDIVLYRTSP